MTVILFLLLSFSAFAQGQFEYHMEGSFTSNVETPVIINYSISWNEAGTVLSGIYQDNYFSQDIPKVVSGTQSDEGRVFNVILPAEVKGINAIRISTTVSNALTGSIPVTIRTTDAVGSTMDSVSGFAMMKNLPGAYEDPYLEANACTIGFGALTGYCGLYAGRFNEFSDVGNRCNILRGNTRLELGTDTFFRMHLNYIPGIPNQPIHNIGAFIPTPLTNNINVSGTTCGPLPGTSFEPNCKEMSLAGSFSEQGARIVFTGIYSIRDQVTGDTCSHSMTLIREALF